MGASDGHAGRAISHLVSTPSSRDRRFACAPFFLPTRSEVSYAPLRLRGGGKRHSSARSTTSRRSSTATSSRIKTRSSRATPLTDLDKLKLEESALRSEVSRLDLALRDVEGDGNCLFRALADQLWGEQKRHFDIRKLTCDYLEMHESELGYWAGLCSFLEGEDYAAYVKRMRKSGQYASEVEVHAAARMLQRSIRIVHADHSETIPCDYEPSAVPVPPEPSSPEPEEATDPLRSPRLRTRTRSSTTCLLATPAAPPPSSPHYATALTQFLPDIKPGRSMLWLALFNDAEHYQSVRRRGDRERGAAHVEDRLALPHEKDRSEAARIARGEMTAPPEASTGAIKQVELSLPPDHGLSAHHISGILARHKGNVNDAVETLLEELNGDDRSEGSSSDHRVEQMLTTQSAPVQTSRLRDIHLARSVSPVVPDSPTGSSATSASRSRESITSVSSKATTPSTHSRESKRSLRSVSGESADDKVGRTKPYARPVSQRRKVKEVSKELEELQVGSFVDAAAMSSV